MPWQPCSQHNGRRMDVGVKTTGGSDAKNRLRSDEVAEFACDYLLLSIDEDREPLPFAPPRRGRRTALTFPLLPPPQKN